MIKKAQKDRIQEKQEYRDKFNNSTDTSQNSIGVGSYTSLLMSEDLVRKASEVETKRSAVNVSLVRNWGMLVERGAPGKQHTHTQTHIFEEVQYNAYS